MAVVKIDDYKKFMEIAIEEAKNSLREGNKGFGAVLIKNGKVITKAHDTEVTDLDPTAHAEMNVLRKTFKNYGADLTGCSIISTHEPCPMCAGALIWAKLSEVVYGASMEDTIKLGRIMIRINCREIIQRSPWKIKLKEGILKEECLKLYNEGIRKLTKKFRKAIKSGWKCIEQELIEKRSRWFEQNKNNILKG